MIQQLHLFLLLGLISVGPVLAARQIKATEFQEYLTTSTGPHRILDFQTDYEREVNGFISGSELVDKEKVLGAEEVGIDPR